MELDRPPPEKAPKRHHQRSPILDGRSRRGRPRLTWRRSVEAELKGRLGLTWSEASKIAQDREGWRDLVGALCATWRKEA